MKGLISKIQAPKQDENNSRRGNDESIRKDLDKIKSQTNELYNWHNINDEDGIKIWYLPMWIRRMFEKIEGVQKTQVDILKSIDERQAEYQISQSETNKQFAILAEIIFNMKESDNGRQRNS